jgi:N-acetylmuramic acid 6-phosphate etherase
MVPVQPGEQLWTEGPADPGIYGPLRMPIQSKWQSLPTEAINPVSLAIDKTRVPDIIDMVVNEDRKVIAAVHKERERIAHGVEIITHSLRRGGRVIFIGAGTSGRLGVVEASEMPPTFGTSPSLVQAIMAGGQEAVFRAKEGVEDNYEEGARSISRIRLTKKDVVVGVSASGMTPFVRGGLTRARKAGAKIIFVTCWPGSELQNFVDLQIAPAVGPEIIAGSTRLKAGTATKMVLNMLTTISMIKVGKTYGNLMVDVRSGSEKLKDRARRILVIVTGITYEEADALLRRAKWNVKAAIVMQKANLTLPQALKRLRKADDLVREAIGEDVEPRLRELLRA